MKFLSNIYDPKDKNAKMYISCHFDETQDEAWCLHCEWLKDKIIGDPQATSYYTVQQLKDMGMVGVYSNASTR